MDTITCIKTRRSIRDFLPDSVSRDLLEQIIEAASFSPSWKNTQISRYIAVEDVLLKDMIADLHCPSYNQKIIKSAPLLIAETLVKKRSGYERDGSFTTDKKDAWQYYDSGIAGGIFSLAAHSLGLSTVIMGVFDYEPVAGLLKVPDDQELMALIAVGYKTEDANPPKKKTVSDLLSYR